MRPLLPIIVKSPLAEYDLEWFVPKRWRDYCPVSITLRGVHAGLRCGTVYSYVLEGSTLRPLRNSWLAFIRTPWGWSLVWRTERIEHTLNQHGYIERIIPV